MILDTNETDLVRTISIRLSDEKHERLLAIAKRRGRSVNELIEELVTSALAEVDAEMRFRAHAAHGSPERALRILGKISTP